MLINGAAQCAMGARAIMDLCNRSLRRQSELIAQAVQQRARYTKEHRAIKRRFDILWRAMMKPMISGLIRVAILRA
jgi:hypothetical protein